MISEEKEAIEELKILKEDYWEDDGYGYATAECQKTITALDMAIEALEQKPCEDVVKKDCDKCAYYDNGANNEACDECFADEYEHPNFKPKAQPCNDCISRQEAINCATLNEFRYKIVEDIKTLPSITPKEKTGKWIFKNDNIAIPMGYYQCSECEGGGRMTLDEAIKQAEEVVEEKNMQAGFDTDYPCYQMSDAERNQCKECAEEHKQLAEWLKELKDYRERIPSYEAGYNDAKREIALSGEYERAYERGKADAQPKMGRWISFGIQGEIDGQIVRAFTCSKCGAISIFRVSNGNIVNGGLCPNCGAKMVEPWESEDKE